MQRVNPSVDQKSLKNIMPVSIYYYCKYRFKVKEAIVGSLYFHRETFNQYI